MRLFKLTWKDDAIVALALAFVSAALLAYYHREDAAWFRKRLREKMAEREELELDLERHMSGRRVAETDLSDLAYAFLGVRVPSQDAAKAIKDALRVDGPLKHHKTGCQCLRCITTA